MQRASWMACWTRIRSLRTPRLASASQQTTLWSLSFREPSPHRCLLLRRHQHHHHHHRQSHHHLVHRNHRRLHRRRRRLLLRPQRRFLRHHLVATRHLHRGRRQAQPHRHLLHRPSRRQVHPLRPLLQPCRRQFRLRSPHLRCRPRHPRFLHAYAIRSTATATAPSSTSVIGTASKASAGRANVCAQMVSEAFRASCRQFATFGIRATNHGLQMACKRCAETLMLLELLARVDM